MINNLKYCPNIIKTHQLMKNIGYKKQKFKLFILIRSKYSLDINISKRIKLITLLFLKCMDSNLIFKLFNIVGPMP